MKKFITLALVLVFAASPALAGRYGGSYSGRSSYSSTRSFSRSYSSPSRGTSSYSRYSRPTYNRNSTTVIHEHNYHGGGSGGLFGNPFFWMYMSDRNNQPQQVPVIVQQQPAIPGAQPQPQQYVQAPPAPTSGSNAFGWLVVLFALGGLSFFFYKKKKAHG